MARLLWLDPFHGGSHAAVSAGYAAHSQHAVTLLTLPQDGGWRWRMRGAAVTLARRLRALTGGAHANSQFDAIVTTDLLDLATFRGLTADITHGLPFALYFHENQLTYPLPPGRKPDLSLPWINYASALAADRVFFNSAFHRQAFLTALPGLTGRYYDHTEGDLLPAIAAKSGVLYPGIDLTSLRNKNSRAAKDTEHAQTPAPARAVASDASEPQASAPTILWNARWEYDKQPHLFFAALEELDRRGVAFRLIVIGEHIDPQEPTFLAARARFAVRALAWGYVPTRPAYAALLHQADIVVSTAAQEFFGLGIIEALACGCVPLLPARLSYPELLPAQHHADYLYQTDADLPDALARLVQHLPARHQFDGPRIAANFDWSVVAPEYDRAFDAIIKP